MQRLTSWRGLLFITCLILFYSLVIAPALFPAVRRNVGLVFCTYGTDIQAWGTPFNDFRILCSRRGQPGPDRSVAVALWSAGWLGAVVGSGWWMLRRAPAAFSGYQP